LLSNDITLNEKEFTVITVITFQSETDYNACETTICWSKYPRSNFVQINFYNTCLQCSV